MVFAEGARLPDPKKLFNWGLEGNKWRGLTLRRGTRSRVCAEDPHTRRGRLQHFQAEKVNGTPGGVPAVDGCQKRLSSHRRLFRF